MRPAAFNLGQLCWCVTHELRTLLESEAPARVAELVDAPDLKFGARKGVPVRPRPWAPMFVRPPAGVFA